MILYLSLMAASLAILIIGADFLVKGSSRLALSMGISPLVVGLTFVAFGTSAPELSVSITSTHAGSSDIAVANVVGSNIFNVLAILGLSSLIAPLTVKRQLIHIHVPIMIGVSILLFSFSIDGRIDLWDGMVFSCLILVYTGFLIRDARRTNNICDVNHLTKGNWRTHLLNLLWLAGGLGGLFIGSQLLVFGAVNFVKLLGVSEAIIGLTVVAAGTSLPELATSVVAAFKGEQDIAIGNIVGSNIFNVCSVVGFTGLTSEGHLLVAPHMLAVDIPFMIGVSLLCLPFFRTGYVLTRTNGVIFLILREQQNQILVTFQTILFDGLLPGLMIGAVVVAVNEMRKEQDIS